jgi:spore maturation protein CgeB
MILYKLKGFYQYVSIKTSLFFAKFLSPAIEDIELTKENLVKRNFKWKAENTTKVIAIFSISNWENKLLEALEIIGPVSHITWDHIHEFYDYKHDWLTEKKKLNDYVRLKFDELYQEDNNIFVFMYVSDFVIDRETIQYFKKRNVLISNFCWDDLLYFKSSHMGQKIGVANISKYVDFNLSFSPEAFPRYHFNRSPVFFWSSVSDTKDLIANDIQLTQIDVANDFYVLFIGSKYGWRANFIEKLKRQGIKVICFGNGWENGALSEDKMKEEIRIAPLTLGFANVGYTRSITTIKGRDFEVPAYGGLYLTQYSKGLELIYRCGKEVLTFDNFKNCLFIINQVQNNWYWANEIRAAGFSKACKMSKWSSKGIFLKDMLDELTKD